MKKDSIKNIIKQVWMDFNAAYSLSKALQSCIFLFLVLFFLDYNNVPLRLICKLYDFPFIVSLVSGVCILLFLLIWALQSVHIITLLKFELFTLFDFASFVLFPSLLAYGILRLFIRGWDCILICSIFFAFVFLALFTGRFYYLYTVKKKALQYETNLVDLKDLAHNKFDTIPNTPIQIAEKDVNYDLLCRDMVIDQLLQSIIFCNPDTSYVISLEGPWGSGKTTVLNSVKEQLKRNSPCNDEIIIIDNFDPWLYGNQNALLAAMYNRIIHAMGLKCDPLNSEHVLKSIMTACASEAAAKFNIGNIVEHLFYGNKTEEKNISELKHNISTYLINSKKRFVFIIDNLDRANDENIIFLFKLINIVFDFPRVIYILSYERERIDSILKQTHELDHRFLEKIIQQEIIIPPIAKEQSKILYSTCMFNLMHAYGISISEAERCSIVFDYIIKHTDNPRNFKRVLNSIFPAVFLKSTSLYLRDLFTIEAIRFFEPNLYYRIHDNPQYFISEGMSSTERLILRRKEFNAAGEEFYSQLKQEFPTSLALLGELFPYAKRYLNNQPLVPDYPYQNPEYKEIFKNSRICHGLYFDLYFTGTTNTHSNIAESVRSFVAVINAGVTVVNIQQTLTENLLTLDSSAQKEWVEKLQLYLNDIDDSQIYPLAAAFTAIYCKIDNCTFFLELSAVERAAYVITVLLQKCQPAEIDNYIFQLEHHYQYLELLFRLCHWMSSSKSDDNINALLPKFNHHYYEMCNEILNNKIDIFQDDYYSAHNSWGLLTYLENEKRQEIGRQYYQSIMSARNIYRILWDFIGNSISENYSYYINGKNLDDYIGNNDLISKCISESTNLSKDEEFVCKCQ